MVLTFLNPIIRPVTYQFLMGSSKGKDIILVDDLYMSGTTLQYVAMKLKEAGARKVFGLCFVKSLSNK